MEIRKKTVRGESCRAALIGGGGQSAKIQEIITSGGYVKNFVFRVAFRVAYVWKYGILKGKSNFGRIPKIL